MTTTSYMVLPVLGLVILIAYLATHHRQMGSAKPIVNVAANYFGCYIYLFLYMAFVAVKDGVGNAVVFNSSYPVTFNGYLSFFGPVTAPTPLSAILFSASALIFTKGARRVFLAWWMTLAILFALNPFAGNLLIKLFRGIFYRMFYILPFPISAGIVVSSISTYAGRISHKIRLSMAYGVMVLTLILGTLAIPSSIFRNRIYALGGWSQHEEYVTAGKIISETPNGPMLAPYPIAGAVRMLSADYPQLITREDMMQYYLGLQNREADAELRLAASQFLSGGSREVNAVLQLLDTYPEIRSVVYERKVYAQINSSELNTALNARGFRSKAVVSEYVVFWK